MSTAQPVGLARPVEGHARPARARRGLLAKYTLSFVALVVFVLAVNSAVEAWIAYGDTLARVRQRQAEAAALLAKSVGDALGDIERQVAWSTRASSTTLERRRADYELVLGDTAAIGELAYVDGTGQTQLDVRRPDDAAKKDDADRTYLEALNHRVWYGPATFADGEPFVRLAIAHAGANAGSTVARVSLASLSKVLDTVLPAGIGYAYAVSSSGQVIAASRNSPVTIGRQIAEADGDPARNGASRGGAVLPWPGSGRGVVASALPLAPLAGRMVVEESTLEAMQPVVGLLVRQAWLLALGLLVAILAGLLLARRMTRPIQALHAGAGEFAQHRFDHRISVGTRDELEDLAGQLNRMADDLAASYGQLEHKVEARTRELEQSLREFEALEEIGRAVAGSLDLRTVLDVIVTRAMSLARADAAAIFIYQPASQTLALGESRGLPETFLQAAAATALRVEAGWPKAEFGKDGLVEIADLDKVSRFPLRQATLDAGFRSVLATALQGPEEKLGVLALYRRAAGDAVPARGAVMKTLADQSVLAINNARLFREVADKGTEIEIANAHRTQFFANMSHELRTPLNAVLGYAELLSDGIYGEIPERGLGVLERIQTNGKHLLGLINDVLDLTKMEAGALTLTLADYSMQDVVASVVAAAEPMAGAKNLALTSLVPPGLPSGRGDDRRLVQVLLNLVGNAVKFTDEGSIAIEVSASGGAFHVAVRDTGPGIAPGDLQRVFEEFQQVEGAPGRKTTGTGLGLTISRRLVAMHGGAITIESRKGQGSVFTVVLPVRVETQKPLA